MDESYAKKNGSDRLFIKEAGEVKVPIQLAKDSREPIYHQIEQQLKALIAGGHLSAGVALPSIRVLSKELEVSVITTRRAYQNLEADGFIETIQGKGTFVAKLDSSLRKATKETAVHEIFEEAIQTALNYDYSYAEIMKLFEKTLKESERGE